jgi:hypothetical protein
MTIVISFTTLLRSSIEIRTGLGDNAHATFKSNLLLKRLVDDLEHAFVIPKSDTVRTRDFKARTLFKIEKGSESDRLVFTYMAHKVLVEDAKESNISLVAYELLDSKVMAGRKDLYRGEFPRVPEDLQEAPPMEKFIEDVSGLTVEFWTGDGWSSDRWDSGSGDGRDSMPQLLRVTSTVWIEKAIEGASEAVVEFKTMAFLPYGLDMKMLKQPTSTFRLSGI